MNSVLSLIQKYISDAFSRKYTIGDHLWESDIYPTSRRTQCFMKVQNPSPYSHLHCILTFSLSGAEKKLHGLNPRANYTDRATAACRRSDCQLLRIEGATWSASQIPTAVFSDF
jgi:hypothetical protein